MAHPAPAYNFASSYLIMNVTLYRSTRTGARGSIQLFGSGLAAPNVELWGRMHGVHYQLQVGGRVWGIAKDGAEWGRSWEVLCGGLAYIPQGYARRTRHAWRERGRPQSR